MRAWSLSVGLACAIVGGGSSEAQESSRHGVPFADSTRYEMPESATRASIPCRVASNQVTIDCVVNETPDVRLVLDSGMPIPGLLLFTSPHVDEAGLTISEDTVMVGGAGDAKAAATARIGSAVRVAMGELTMRDVPVLLMERPKGFPENVDGIVGGALFFRFAVRIDMSASTIDVIEPTAFEPAAGASVLPLRQAGGFVFVRAALTIDEQDPVDAELVVDLGANHALSIYAHNAAGIQVPARTIETVVGRGLLSPIRGKIGRVRSIRLGDFTVDGVVTSFLNPEHAHAGDSNETDGNLGAGLLRRFVVTFDHAASRIVLERGTEFDEPFEHDMSGLAFDLAYGGEREVIAVVDGSPAARAGIEVGDVVVALDGTPIGEFSERVWRDKLRVDGAHVTLRMRRGDASRDVELVLERQV